MIIRGKKELRKIIQRHQESGKKVLIKRGCFDIIHPGHCRAIKEFKKYADIIVILVMSDSTVKFRKVSKRPINNQLQRMEVIDNMQGVDYVFQDKTKSREEYVKLLKFLKPNILAILKDDAKKQMAYTNPLWQLKQSTDRKNKDFSTTNIINKIIKKYC